MDEQRARQILGDLVLPNNGLDFIAWDDDGVTLDGTFNADDLEALAWWMRTFKVPKA